MTDVSLQGIELQNRQLGAAHLLETQWEMIREGFIPTENVSRQRINSESDYFWTARFKKDDQVGTTRVWLTLEFLDSQGRFEKIHQLEGSVCERCEK